MREGVVFLGAVVSAFVDDGEAERGGVSVAVLPGLLALLLIFRLRDELAARC